MLKINTLKIEIETKDQKFGREIDFLTTGLNIIKGDNHSGKSTIASSLFYALGMEELLGGRNTVALDSILTTKVPQGKSLDLDIQTSKVVLKIENNFGKKIELTRYIKHYEIESKVIKVNEENEERFYFLHDAGSAGHDNGFYNYLEKFLGFNLPSVPKFEGGEAKLYLQILFNAFFIEQIKGWTDYFAAIPNFGIKDSKKRIIEYILNLTTFEYEQKKNQYEDNKKEIALEWDNQITQIKEKVDSISGVLQNLPEVIRGEELLNSHQYDVYFKISSDNSVTLEEYYQILMSSKVEIETSLNQPKNDIDKKLIKLKRKLKTSLDDLFKLGSVISAKKDELKVLGEESNHLSKEMENLTDLLKIERYTHSTAENTHKALKGICPTCENPISPSVYKHLEIMGLQENKDYLKSQNEILKTYIEALRKEIQNEENFYKQLQEEYQLDKEVIKYLEKDLINDKNLPSMAMMKELVNVDNKIEKLEAIKKELISSFENLKRIAKDWDKNERTKEKYNMSIEDRKKT